MCGGEAANLLQALNTGHGGSLPTDNRPLLTLGDALQVATGLIYEAETIHTFDERDRRGSRGLLTLNGDKVVRLANPSHGGQIYGPNELDHAFERGLVGASRRSLSETFGSDAVSFENILRFLEE